MRELAEKVDSSVEVISRIESGKDKIGDRMLLRLAGALGLSYPYFFE